MSESFLSPLSGLVAFGNGVPRLTPWAIIYRRSAAGAMRHHGMIRLDKTFRLIPAQRLLTPWATVWRRCAADAMRHHVT